MWKCVPINRRIEAIREFLTSYRRPRSYNERDFSHRNFLLAAHTRGVVLEILERRKRVAAFSPRRTIHRGYHVIQYRREVWYLRHFTR